MVSKPRIYESICLQLGEIWSVHFKGCFVDTQEDTPKTNEDKQAFSAQTQEGGQEREQI